MPIRSRQIQEAVGEGVLAENTSYCRKCMMIKPKPMFSKTTTPDLDGTGCLSLCKSCVDSMYLKILSSENGNIQKTILRLCRLLNVRYEESAIESALKHIETKQSNPEKLFGLYRAKLLVLFRTNVSDTNVDLSYQFNNDIVIPVDENKFQLEEYKDMDELRRFWGINFTPEEIITLEGKFSDWSKSHSIDTQSERVLLKFICLKEYEIDKAVREEHSTAALMKEFQDLLKTSALSPSSSSSLNGGKSMDAFGVWLADIMQYRPEEWVEDKSIYKDVDNIEAYGEKFLTSPMRALVTGSREFSLDADEVIEDEMEGE
jgi:hypothetical protein